MQTEGLTKAFNVNLDSLVSKEYLAARFAEQKAYIDTRFAEQRAEFETQFRILTIVLRLVLTAVVLPYLERLLVL